MSDGYLLLARLVRCGRFVSQSDRAGNAPIRFGPVAWVTQMPLRIIHCANFDLGKDGALYNSTTARKLTNGFVRNGHFVYDLSYRDMARFETPFRSKKLGTGRMNKRLIRICRNVRPDWLCLGHAEVVRVETLRQLREEMPQMKVSLWWVDPVWDRRRLQYIIDRVPYLDAVFVTTGGDVLRTLKGDRNVVAFFPNAVDPSIERGRNFERADLDIDVVYCGRDDPGASERAKLLDQFRKRLDDVTIDINGSFGFPCVFGAAYEAKLLRAKMGLNLSRRADYTLYSSDRIAQIAGNGLLVLCQSAPEHTILFSEEEVVYFCEPDELAVKVMRLCKDDGSRRRIAKAGWCRAHASYNERRVAKFLTETVLGETYSEPYEWLRHVLR